MAEMTVLAEQGGTWTVNTVSGSTAAVTTLTAASTIGAGTAVDFQTAKQNTTIAIVASAGVSAGAVALEVSQDGTNWFQSPPVTLTSPGVSESTQIGAWRHARGNVTTTIVGGTVTATVMSS